MWGGRRVPRLVQTRGELVLGAPRRLFKVARPIIFVLNNYNRRLFLVVKNSFCILGSVVN